MLQYSIFLLLNFHEKEKNMKKQFFLLLSNIVFKFYHNSEIFLCVKNDKPKRSFAYSFKEDSKHFHGINKGMTFSPTTLTSLTS